MTQPNYLGLSPEFTHLVVHCKRTSFDEYIGRPGPWGNPFSDKNRTLAKYRVKTRLEAVQKYEQWVLGQPEMIERIKRELKGKILGCWCAPQLCHGHVLARIANQ